jgi:hypothetical protein
MNYTFGIISLWEIAPWMPSIRSGCDCSILHLVMSPPSRDAEERRMNEDIGKSQVTQGLVVESPQYRLLARALPHGWGTAYVKRKKTNAGPVFRPGGWAKESVSPVVIDATVIACAFSTREVFGVIWVG